jgi:hypothetical protein
MREREGRKAAAGSEVEICFGDRPAGGFRYIVRS